VSTVAVVLDRDPASAGQARRLARSLLTGRVDDEITEIVELLVSEVVTNVVLHATTSPRIRLALLTDRVRAEINDADPDREARVRRSQDPTATSGRGLAIVDALADDWGIDTEPGVGKCVWFEVLVPSR
jgi:anti-sigma regulatory factor (Ser/Thr protein kinase)